MGYEWPEKEVDVEFSVQINGNKTELRRCLLNVMSLDLLFLHLTGFIFLCC